MRWVNATGRVASVSIVVREIRRQLKRRLTPKACFHMVDESYWLTPFNEVVSIIKREKVYERQYRPRIRDCDDFAAILYVRMIESQQNNSVRNEPHAFGEVHGILPSGERHAMNIMLNSDGVVRIVEPQEPPATAIKTIAESGLTDIWFIRM